VSGPLKAFKVPKCQTSLASRRPPKAGSSRLPGLLSSQVSGLRGKPISKGHLVAIAGPARENMPKIHLKRAPGPVWGLGRGRIKKKKEWCFSFIGVSS